MSQPALWQLVVGSVTLSVVHAAIPNHWIPLVAVGRREGWSRAEAAFGAAVTGLAHTTSTILIGIAVGLVGREIAERYEPHLVWVAPLVLAAFGIYYLIRGISGEHHHHHAPASDDGSSRSRWVLLGGLALAMFFSPCLEIEAYFFLAGSLGWVGIALVSIVYLTVTVACMTGLVLAGYAGAERFRWQLLEHHEGVVTGVLLLALAALAGVIGL